ncbi:type IV conjugative transfer system coupling protein TraD [Legionella drozanskii]|uniref:Conjugative transfer protein TraD n=1 Tax=Legionella drozanskii LLAP-1 TaxID=1212489 RepID=A0A0W0SWK5_9GAMM|nr:type IV conjugative transfer system coupling protein TraD [Legionella drozanskii]KTC87644.1 conjugative transfer protein TraD [Legionella drozanskii LLAP-1]
MSNESNYKHYTRGGQISFHNLRMWFQINKALFQVYLFIWAVLSVLVTWVSAPHGMISQALAYHGAHFYHLAGKSHVFSIPVKGGYASQTVEQILHNHYFAATSERLLTLFLQSVLWAFPLSLIVALLVSRYFIYRGKAQTQNQFIRGASLVPAETLKKQIIKEKKASDLTLDGFPLLQGAEVQHVLVHGTVGMGKSQFIMKLMDCLRARGDRVIVYDKGCTFTEAYFQESHDVLLNPFDARCANWDLWREAPKDELLENMAESLIPMHGETDPFWVNAARTVFASVASKMREDNERSLDKLIRLLVTGEFSELEPYLVGTAAATLVSNKIEKTAISIRSVITTYLKSMQSLSGLEASSHAPFSIRDYLLNKDLAGWLFISSNGEQHKSLKPLISMWIAMASLTLLSLPEDANRRIWFICDELPSLHKLPLLGETIAEVRKFGGCFLLGMQSFSQLEKVYGRSGAAEIFDLLNTRAFFASPSHEMAQLVSKELGNEEIDDTRENYSYGANSIRDGISLGKNRITRPLVTYPEIMGLDPLTCYLRLPGQYPITKLELHYQKRSAKAAGFLPRAIPSLPACNAALKNESADNNSTDRRVDVQAPTNKKRVERECDMESIF